MSSANWPAIRGEFAIVERTVPVLGGEERPLVYLDHAATTHAPRSVIAEYVNFLEHEYSNVHRGTHLLSRRATARFEEAHEKVAEFIGAELEHGAICFVTNTTQAIDLASHVMAQLPGRVLTTEMEHHSNELPHRRRGEVGRVRIGSDGLLDMNHLEELLRAEPVKLVAVTGAANVTGLMPDIRALTRMAHAHGALVLVDAAQLLAHHPIDVRGFFDPEHIDFLAGAGHKAYAPFGAGFLYGPRKLFDEAPPYLPGGGNAVRVTENSVEYLPAPDKHHGGTPNIAGVVGLTESLAFLRSIGLDEIRRHEVKLIQKAISGMQALGGITIYGAPDPDKRLGVISFNVEGVSELMTAAVFSEEGGIAVRNGRFCAHIYVDKLLRLHHAHKSGEIPGGAARASFGVYNDESDVDRFLEQLKQIRDKRWVGRYQIKGGTMMAEFASRCADHWMESA